VTEWLLYVFVFPSLALWVGYVIAIQYYRGGRWEYLKPFTILVALIDVILNYTYYVPLTWDFPRNGEVTISKRLNRLVTETGTRGRICRAISKYLLDPFDPRGRHIIPNGEVYGE
jgi:hypothetical protein